MNEIKHSPAPWEIAETTRDILAETKGEGNGWYEIALSVNTKANAQLIAAAPELLEACKMALPLSIQSPKELEVRELMKKAIKKATQDLTN